ncbi:1-deoxy-D-xylulose-5-phosphate synthase [Cellvibrio polysaccharolyticus]|uniref:1-deoxy-D-xylulose-5-phosphate synthase n=1 Tax=Cellvibrio polysaccharolyticus TaxID=2082724 RepID=A0A928V4K3_9GAMM|nr:1-deoxy-D-xylulose-5-phosphate synthase [Cellvibrio polysaccharolyticus]MBE8716014.1 1-deoxy-D-xylulose-5-phosphate synthase [Cellvibrio polysaccharolyticus]
MFNEIPVSRPDTPLLDSIDSPADLRALDEKQLPELAQQLRAFLLYTVGQTGGHFGAGLGVVELTIALHYVYETPDDRLVWDVGHQTYPHKILTSRRERMNSMRKGLGLSGFPKRDESEYDTFGVGHSSTSLSAGLGMTIGSRMAGSERKSVAVIGDGAMTAGMAFEALNHAAHIDNDMLVILNDNNMSISPNVGGLATYLSRIWGSRFYNALREGSKQVLTKIPQAWEFARKTEEHFKGFVSPGTLFEEMGFNYIGPIDGHDLPRLVRYLRNLREIKGPKLLHIITRKGKGFTPAEEDPVGYHALNKIEPKKKSIKSTDAPVKPKYQDVFGQWLCDTAAQDERLVGITPAMCEGSGMVSFAQQYPERFYDVAIAEQHAVTLAAGIACEGQKPVVAIYSTFLQRAYDQLVHDVALQHLDVTFAIDRAGLVGEDGPTHAGSFDISFLRCIPDMVLATPSDENECRQLLYTAYQHNGPAAVRYPRGTGTGAVIEKSLQELPIGKGVVRREGKQVAILNFGTSLPAALQVAEKLNATVCDMRFAKPLDTELIERMAASHGLLVTLEENAIAGGAGSGVGEHLANTGIVMPIMHLGFEDRFIEHNSQSVQLAGQGLDAAGIESAIQARLSLLASGKATLNVS